MKTTKILGIGAAGLLVIIIAAVVYLWSSLDSLVEAAIEKYGSQATKTNVEVGGVKLSLTSGAGSVKGLQVGNPTGFSRKNRPKKSPYIYEERGRGYVYPRTPFTSDN